MINVVDNRGVTDPAVNLALEEYCLTCLDSAHDCLLMYVNGPAVVIGKHQNAFAEADIRFLSRNRIPLARRVSGGGAVYHDYGNLNFSFIAPHDRHRFVNYEVFLKPIIDALNRMGVDARMGEKNDVFIQDKKISGNAQYSNTRRMMCHGTLLFDANLEALHDALSPSGEVVQSRGVPSIRSAVANLRPHLRSDMDMDAFGVQIRDDIIDAAGGSISTLDLDETAWDEITGLAEEKYRSWNWNIGKSPDSRIRLTISGDDGESAAVTVDIHQGSVDHVRLPATGISLEYIEKIIQQWPGMRFDDLLNTFP